MNINFFIDMCYTVVGVSVLLAGIIAANHYAIQKEYRWENDCAALECIGCENCKKEEKC